MNGITRAGGSLILVPFDRASLVDLLTQHARFQRWDKRDEQWKDTDCPKAVAETLLARRGQWRFPQLRAVVSAPTMRPDGTILSKPGFDVETGIVLHLSGKWPSIPSRPSRDVALAALAVLAEPIEGFPFVSSADRSAALTMILTALVRASLPTAPLFGVTAPTPGTGKSYLIDIAAILSTGTTTPVVAATDADEEMAKRVGSALMAGDSLLSLDNVERPLKSEFLCQVLSQQSIKIRVLGESRNLDLPTAVTMAATGNSLRFAGDLVRRAVLIRLDAGVERPEDRVFNFDPRDRARRHRQRLVVAGLTILRAFVFARADPIRPALGGFSEWSNLVRSALVWLGQADPLANNTLVRADDPERERNGAILAALPTTPWTVQDLAQRVENEHFGISKSALYEVLSEFMAKGRFDSRGFGNWCRKHRDRIIAGHQLVQVGEDSHAKVVRWQVKRLEGDAGTAG